MDPYTEYRWFSLTIYNKIAILRVSCWVDM